MLPSDLLNNIAVLIVAILVGLYGYFKRPKRQTPQLTVTGAAIGLSWLEREQAERMLSSIDTQAKAQVRIASALESLADKKTTDMGDDIKTLVDQVEELLSNKPKPPPRRR